MTSYQDYLQQIEDLKRKAEDARRQELRDVIGEVNAKIAEYGLTARDLKFSGRARGGKGSVKAKYRDPATGSTWTGRGRAPRWLTDAEARGARREQFAVD
jgi:DNA-binding protein H-NS